MADNIYQIYIYCTFTGEGQVFGLEYISRELIKNRFEGSHMCSRIFLAQDKPIKYIRRDDVPHIVKLLTGVPSTSFDVIFVDPITNEKIGYEDI